MANPAPTINQINAFNATQGTTIDFNIIGGTELVRSNRIYIYDLSDNSLICTHLYVSTESIHELPPNTDGSIVYESGKSSADFVNGAQYYAQIQTFTDIAGTQGGSGLSVSKLFWCLVDPSLTIDTIPSTISTTSYNVSATYDANTSVVSNIIQQYQFSLYSATGSLLQSSGVVVGNGEQQGTSTAYDISYNFSGLSVGSSYYVVVDVTTTQGMSVTTQSGTFTVSIDTPTLGEATVVNNACDGYISVTSNLSSEYGGSGSGEIVSFETDSENVFTKLQVDLEPVQDLHGYDAPWVGGAGKNKLKPLVRTGTTSGISYSINADGSVTLNGTATTVAYVNIDWRDNNLHPFDVTPYIGKTLYASMTPSLVDDGRGNFDVTVYTENSYRSCAGKADNGRTFTYEEGDLWGRSYIAILSGATFNNETFYPLICFNSETDKSWTPYENICPITAPTTSANLLDLNTISDYSAGGVTLTVGDDKVVATGTATSTGYKAVEFVVPETGTYHFKLKSKNGTMRFLRGWTSMGTEFTETVSDASTIYRIATAPLSIGDVVNDEAYEIQVVKGTTALIPYRPYGENAQLIITDNQLYDPDNTVIGKNWIQGTDATRAINEFFVTGGETYKVKSTGGNFSTILFIEMNGFNQITNFALPLDKEITVPENCDKIIIQFQKSTAITQSDFDGFVCSVSKEYITHTTTVVDNIWDEEWENGYYNRENGVKAGDSNTTYFRSKNFIPCLPNTSYYFTSPSAHANNNTWYAVLYYDENKNFISATSDLAIYPQKTTPINANYMTFYVEVGTSGATYENDISIMPTAFTGGKVYGGSLDFVTGLLTVTHACMVIDSTKDWNTYTANSMNIHRINVPSLKVSRHTREFSCSHFKRKATDGQASMVGEVANQPWNSYNLEFILNAGTTNAEWKQYLNEQKSNGTPVQLYYYLATPQTYQLTPQQIQTLVGKNNVWSEQGEVEVAYNIPITNLLVKRQDVADVSGDWLTLYSQPITQASDMDFTFIDFLNQYGKTYKYALVPLLTQTQSGVEVEVEGGYTVSDEVQSIFDGVFIADSTGSQKCKANVGYGNVDMNQTVGTITPIGAKYPVVITNSKNQYHNGSISGTIVPDDYYFNGNLSRIDMVNKRDELEQFLTNKRAKIIKDWNGKIWLVMIMDNVSCTFNNNYGMGIVNFNTNWVEVGDPTNQQDLQATGLINVGGV